MKRLFTVLVVLFAVGAMAAFGLRRASETQALTRAVPTASSFTSAASVSLDDVTGYYLVVCAESTRTLSGAGTIDIYSLDEETGLVALNKSLVETVNASGVRCQRFPDHQVVASKAGRMMPAANSITVSGGTTVTIYTYTYAAKSGQ